MLELSVYCYGVLRYSVIGDLDKLQELQDRGYYVQARPALRSKIVLGVDNRNEQFMSIKNSNVFVDHEDGIHKPVEVRPANGYYTPDFR